MDFSNLKLKIKKYKKSNTIFICVLHITSYRLIKLYERIKNFKCFLFRYLYVLYFKKCYIFVMIVI